MSDDDMVGGDADVDAPGPAGIPAITAALLAAGRVGRCIQRHPVTMNWVVVSFITLEMTLTVVLLPVLAAAVTVVVWALLVTAAVVDTFLS
jgi:hypothetical protein